MSFLGLSILGSALDAYQQAADVTSNDIANVNTPGASRQSVNFQEATPIVGSPGYDTLSGVGTQGTGVVVQSITRIHQDSYDGLFRGASSAQNYFTVEQQQLQSVQSAFGEPNNGVSAAFTALQTAISQLASNPTEVSDQQGVITAAQSFAGTLNSVGSAVQSAQASVVQQAGSTVNQINGLLDQIASLNGQIRAATAVGENPNTYEDERDNDIDTLSQYVNVQTSVQANGSALVSVNGRALVNDTQAYHLAAPVVTTNASGTPTLVVGFANDPNPASPATIDAGSGELGGYLDLYNTKLASYGQQLNSFAASAADAIDRVSTAGYDQNGNPGAALFVPAAPGTPITATNISVGITSPTELPTALASTAAGDLTVALNAANDTVSTTAAVLGNATLAHPAAASGGSTAGTLTVTVDGAAQSFAYDFGAGGNADTIDDFIDNFNAAQLGVTASYDATAQQIVFARDPTNVSAAHLAAQGANPTTPSFTISDSNAPAGGSQGTPSSSLLEVLGAAGIDGVPQDATNAVGASDNAGTNALLSVFSSQVGIPAVQTAASNATAVGPGTVTVGAATAGAFANVTVGQTLTIDAGTANAENVTVTAVNQSAGTITFDATKAHAAGFSVSAVPSQTLSAYYGTLVAQLGNDTSTATTGASSQSSLASSINSARQSVDGINVDEETQNLIQYQSSYQAAAQTMNVLDQLLQATLAMIPS
ncbi:MAG TPA: flagellar hook-associated protein FlgK [Candidatus Baltobacteraceae bacterium]|nr:flagellar hook-associated protein FlgK [Candidatus Baltobacteraceae bacterium]